MYSSESGSSSGLRALCWRRATASWHTETHSPSVAFHDCRVSGQTTTEPARSLLH